MPNTSFQKGSSGKGKSKSYTFKQRGPVNDDGDTRNRTKAVTIRCDGKGSKRMCAEAKRLANEAMALARNATSDEESYEKGRTVLTGKRAQKPKTNVPF